MTSVTQDEKRKRAASFPAEGGLAAGSTAVPGPLAVQWDSVFDRMCYMVTSADLAIRNARRYRKLMDEIIPVEDRVAQRQEFWGELEQDLRRAEALVRDAEPRFQAVLLGS